MNNYEAILAAAAHIELHPETYEFWNNDVPRACEDNACALGWIGYFLGLEPRTSAQYEVANLRLGIDPAKFYSTMDGLLSLDLLSEPGWRRSPSLCAKGLRLYAQKYLMPEAV